MQKPKRFYKSASAVSVEAGYILKLDDRELKSPGKRQLLFPTQLLAEGAAAEWEAQSETIDLAAMPLNALTNAVTDHVIPRVSEVQDEILRFLDTDMLACWADGPDGLEVRQTNEWGPLLEWAKDAVGIELSISRSLSPPRQAPATLTNVKSALTALDPFRLMIVHGLTTRLHSIVLALAVERGRLDMSAAWELSRLEEIYQNEKWGVDEEAAARTEQISQEINDLGRFFSLL